ncbi:MAG: hypothetical protein GY945_00380 [Rhodobacteraceae bacterium]|nr:hypothetical protein [Paracoccaceae bacterium]
MFRLVSSLVLIVTLTVSSLGLAAARGTSPDFGQEIAICSGTSMTTITIGPDGQPIEKRVVCPDGVSIFAADFTLPDMALPEARLLASPPNASHVPFTTRNEIFPAARGPPETA